MTATIEMFAQLPSWGTARLASGRVSDCQTHESMQLKAIK
jgi:hypothetical protein